MKMEVLHDRRRVNEALRTWRDVDGNVLNNRRGDSVALLLSATGICISGQLRAHLEVLRTGKLTERMRLSQRGSKSGQRESRGNLHLE